MPIEISTSSLLGISVLPSTGLFIGLKVPAPRVSQLIKAFVNRTIIDVCTFVQRINRSCHAQGPTLYGIVNSSHLSPPLKQVLFLR
ncbi:hypothetical protein COOONC_21634 [Cooperia oncophora]